MSSQDIVLYCLPGILLLHQWNMLISCGMEDHFRPKLFKYLLQSGRVFNIANHKRCGDIWIRGSELLLHVIECELVQFK